MNPHNLREEPAFPPSRVFRGTRCYDAIDLCLSEPGRIIATAGAKESLQTTDRVWPVKVNAKSGRPVLVLYFDHNLWAGRFYRETIQQFDPKRHRPYAPATYFATDTGDDYFQELMQEHEIWKNRKTIWEKESHSAVTISVIVKRSGSSRTGAFVCPGNHTTIHLDLRRYPDCRDHCTVTSMGRM